MAKSTELNICHLHFLLGTVHKKETLYCHCYSTSLYNMSLERLKKTKKDWHWIPTHQLLVYNDVNSLEKKNIINIKKHTQAMSVITENSLELYSAKAKDMNVNRMKEKSRNIKRALKLWQNLPCGRATSSVQVVKRALIYPGWKQVQQAATRVVSSSYSLFYQCCQVCWYCHRNKRSAMHDSIIHISWCCCKTV